LRILYLYQYLSTREGSGLSRAYEFALRLQEKGHQITVVTSPTQLPPVYRDVARTTYATIDGISVIILPVPYSNKMSFPRRIRSFLAYSLHAARAAIATPADVIYASSSPLTICIPAILGSMWQRIPMVFEVRDLWPELPIAMGALKNPLARWAAQAMEWASYHWATHVVALSPGMKAGVMRRGIADDRVTVIPNSSDVDLFTVPAEDGLAFRERLGIGAEQPLLVYAGTFGLANNIDYIVDIASKMRTLDPEVHFLLIGGGMQYDHIRQKTTELGLLGANMTILPSVPKKEMPSVYSAATVVMGILAPLREMWNSSPNKIFDAFAASRPIAVNYGGWIADLCATTGVGIRLPEQNAEGAATALRDFVRSPERLDRARSASATLAIEEFDRAKMADRLETVLKSALKDA